MRTSRTPYVSATLSNNYNEPLSSGSTDEINSTLAHLTTPIAPLVAQNAPVLPVRSPIRRIAFSPVSSLVHFIEDNTREIPSLVQLAETFAAILNPAPLLMGSDDSSETARRSGYVAVSGQAGSGADLRPLGGDLLDQPSSSSSAYSNWLSQAQRSRQAAALTTEAEMYVRFGGTVINCRSAIDAKILQYYNYIQGYSRQPSAYWATQVVRHTPLTPLSAVSLQAKITQGSGGGIRGGLKSSAFC